MVLRLYGWFPVILVMGLLGLGLWGEQVEKAHAGEDNTVSYDMIVDVYIDGDRYEAVAKGEFDFKANDSGSKAALDSNSIIVVFKGDVITGMGIHSPKVKVEKVYHNEDSDIQRLTPVIE